MGFWPSGLLGNQQIHPRPDDPLWEMSSFSEASKAVVLLADTPPSGASRIVAPPLPHLDLHISGKFRSGFVLAFAALEPTGVVAGVLG